MRILGIETSCDETAAAVVEDGTKIFSNIVASSAEMHAETGGIIPERAARQQIKSIIPVISKAFKIAFPESTNLKSQISNIDVIAVTYGPGLIGSLLVGVEVAKTLSYIWDKPIIPINHLVAHIYANWLETSTQISVNEAQKNAQKKHLTPSAKKQTPTFPALALVVSGGHTDLVLMKGHGDIVWIGGTRDDAAGEAFDKCARLLGLPYPGGPSISKEADKYLSKQQTVDNQKLNLFPRPLIDEENYDWSFSGLKTAVLRETQNTKNIEQNIHKFSAEVQEAIVESLIVKSIRAIKEYNPKCFLLSGGVAANKRLKEKFASQIKESTNLNVKFFAPTPKLATDNAAVIASAAFFEQSPIPWQQVDANPQLPITGEV